MNYRHDYHAGNLADVHKHLVVSLIMTHLKSKDKPFFVLDTHGGSGIYDLHSDLSIRTGEATQGAVKFFSQSDIPPVFDAWCRVNQAVNISQPEELRYYAGSPELIRQLLRPQDRLVACELHPQDVRQLKRTIGHDKRTVVHHRDGYEAIPALLPPAENRGLVLIDPPYETGKDFSKMRKALEIALHRWRGGIFVIWYPIKNEEEVRRFHADLASISLPEQLISELVWHSGNDEDVGLRGSGLLILNPPWKLEEQLAEALPWIQSKLQES